MGLGFRVLGFSYRALRVSPNLELGSFVAESLKKRSSCFMGSPKRRSLCGAFLGSIFARGGEPGSTHEAKMRVIFPALHLIVETNSLWF